nr:probable prolyl 4-hydroxylase 10 isoform X1 [Tanacetum cinerariifolium]
HARIMYANGHLARDCNFSYDGIDLPHMEKSTVVDNVTNTSKDSRLRTSSGKFMDRGQDETIRAIGLHFLTWDL